MTKRKKMLRAVGVSLVLYVLAFVVLSLGGYARLVYVVIGGAVLPAGGAVGLKVTLNRARRENLLPACGCARASAAAVGGPRFGRQRIPACG